MKVRPVTYYRPGDKAWLEVIENDILTAECKNRRQCVIAHAMNRQYGLQGKGYIRIDAAHAEFTNQGKRYHWILPPRAVDYLRVFDELGDKYGQDLARVMMAPRTFRIKLDEVNVIPPKASEARKKQINAARNKRYAEAKAAALARGEEWHAPKPRPRYAGA